jgi:hypothetical protein
VAFRYFFSEGFDVGTDDSFFAEQRGFPPAEHVALLHFAPAISASPACMISSSNRFARPASTNLLGPPRFFLRFNQADTVCSSASLVFFRGEEESLLMAQ